MKKQTMFTPDELDFATRILRTATDFKTMNDVADILRTLAKEHEDLSLTQVLALSAASGMISGTAKALQRERDEKASGGNLTSLDV